MPVRKVLTFIPLSLMPPNWKTMFAAPIFIAILFSNSTSLRLLRLLINADRFIPINGIKYSNDSAHSPAQNTLYPKLSFPSFSIVPNVNIELSMVIGSVANKRLSTSMVEYQTNIYQL